MNVNEIMLIFCQYGFRKASMEDIARAADLSRQSIYKKFGSKEGVFEWAIAEVARLAYDKAMAALQNPDRSVSDRIAQAFDHWTGDNIPIVRNTPHGAEILNKAIDVFMRDGHKGEVEFYAAIEQLLLEEAGATSQQQAADKSFALAMAAKGLLLKAETQSIFRSDLARVIGVILT